MVPAPGRVRHPQFPARGRKPVRGATLLINTFLGSDTLNSPQGDGNFITGNWEGKRDPVRHPQFPARGRKPNSNSQIPSSPRVRHPQFPARGRKLSLQPGEAIPNNVRHPQFPARGRKLDELADKYGVSPNTGQTPSIPRKGTETPLFPISFA